MILIDRAKARMPQTKPQKIH